MVNVESSIVMDGGSLRLSLFDEVQSDHYTMDRSVASFNTPRYVAIADEKGRPPTSAERCALSRRLHFWRDTLPEDDPNLFVLDEYLKAVRRD